MRSLVRSLSLALSIPVAASACKRTEEPPPSSSHAASATAEPPAPPFSRLPAPAKIAAIGDLHGDLSATRAALRLAGAIGQGDSWTGGTMAVVQTGDQVDRGDDDRAVVDLFVRLAEAANAAGGQVISLVGNHEVMNVEQRFDYVSEGGFRGFVGVPGADARNPRIGAVPEASRARAAAFLPGGPYARVLAKRPVAVLMGSTVFVHGGLSPKHVRYGVDKINGEMSSWMQGETPRAPAIGLSEDAPTWLRRYSAAPDQDDCKVLDKTLGMIGAKRMVMGHTVQRGGITSACAEQAWRIDVGMSSSYGGSPQVLIIEGDKVSIARSP